MSLRHPSVAFVNVPEYMVVGQTYQLEVETEPQGLPVKFSTPYSANANVTKSGRVTILSIPASEVIGFSAIARFGSKTTQVNVKSIPVYENEPQGENNET